MAWSARMMRFLEETGQDKSNPSYLKKLRSELNTNLGGNGTIKGIAYDDDSSNFKVVYQDNSGNNYIFDVNSAGEFTVEEENSHITEEAVVAELTRTDNGNDVYVARVGVVSIGDDADTNVSTINGVDVAKDWKVFWYDNDNVYLIYPDYFPISAVSSDEVLKISGDRIYFDVGEAEITADGYLNNGDNWNSIKTSLENGTLEGTNIEVFGAPTLEMWVNSWNKVYNNELSYSSIKESGLVAKSTMQEKNGYNNTLYYPQKTEYYGYWLAEKNDLFTTVQSQYCLFDIIGDGWIGSSIVNNSSAEEKLSIRPIVKISKSEFKTKILQLGDSDEVEYK